MQTIFHRAARASKVKIIGAFNHASGFADRRIPAYVPRDKITKKLISAAVLAYVCDMWNPLPIGETIAALCLMTATARGAYLYKHNHKTTSQMQRIKIIEPALERG